DARLYIRIEVTADSDCRSGREDDLGGFGGQTAALVRRASLHQHGLPLWRARDIEWTSDLEMLTLVPECMHLVRVEEDAGVPIHDESVVVPAVPQYQQNVGKLSCPSIPLRGACLWLRAEVPPF